MKLINFEQSIDNRILKRGLDYFEQGHVVNIETKDKKRYKASVEGSEAYRVEISLDLNDEIVESYCDCPYDLGEFCKHEAAVLFALKNEKTLGEPAVVVENDLKQVLAEQNKDELVRILLEISDDYPDIEKRLLFKFANNEDEITASKKLIREYINNAKRNGFIDWRHVDYALQGAEMTLNKAREKIEIGDSETAVLLALEVLSPVVRMLQYCDDSNGGVSFIMNRAISAIEQGVSTSLEQLDEKEQKKLFEVILKEALKKQYDGWSDWRFGLLNVCTIFSHKKDMRKKLEKQLETLEQKADSSWSERYEKKQVKLLQFEIIEKCDGTSAAEKFINKNINISDFREKAITRALENGDYEKVLELSISGEEVDKSFPGLVNKWREYRYQAYEGLGDVENQRKLAYEFLFSNRYSYYAKLKELYNHDEWNEVLGRIIESFEKERYQSSVYIDILKEEKLTKQIIEYCKKHKSIIIDLYPYLLENHFEEANDLFIQYIELSAEGTSDRRGYRNVCKHIKTYKKAFGAIHSHKLIGALKQKYQKRPAFIDELGKIR
ncbi:SWIM zinc finger family protein [Neobacillus niacini]|uniref:SWIM zinc finger family protein n=1 Tax=Neobacillus niacini TaxID=86668 RepID=UPI003B02A645